MARKKTNLPFVISVTSNLKSPTGDEWTMELGQKTLIIGSNTSHKSAVLQAVELAVSGAADDITGRLDVRDPGLLLTLAPADTLSSSVTFSGDDIEPASYWPSCRQRYMQSTETSRVRSQPVRLPLSNYSPQQTTQVSSNATQQSKSRGPRAHSALWVMTCLQSQTRAAYSRWKLR